MLRLKGGRKRALIGEGNIFPIGKGRTRQPGEVEKTGIEVNRAKRKPRG